MARYAPYFYYQRASWRNAMVRLINLKIPTPVPLWCTTTILRKRPYKRNEQIPNENTRQ